MHLLLVLGFLGSGKTTLVIRLAKAAVEQGRRVAILVNEIGEIGIDNQLMRQLDLNVWELVNGCICCTLSGDLVATLQTLDSDYHPDLVIVEPSGAADPRSILQAMPYYRGAPLESFKTLSILDPLRFSMLMEVMTPLVTAHIEHADLVLVGKCDLAKTAEITFTQQSVAEIKPQVQVIPANLRELPVETLHEVLPWLK